MVRKEILLSKSIFGSKKTDKELLKLKQKLAGLPKETIRALRASQNSIKRKVAKDSILERMIRGNKQLKM